MTAHRQRGNIVVPTSMGSQMDCAELIGALSGHMTSQRREILPSVTSGLTEEKICSYVPVSLSSA